MAVKNSPIERFNETRETSICLNYEISPHYVETLL